MAKIEIEYDGGYPNLCRGKLVVVIDGIRWEFPNYCLSSGGSPWSEDYGPPEYGEWSISEWPEGFPEEMMCYVEDRVNEEIPHGCCGGCL